MSALHRHRVVVIALAIAPGCASATARLEESESLALVSRVRVGELTDRVERVRRVVSATPGRASQDLRDAAVVPLYDTLLIIDRVGGERVIPRDDRAWVETADHRERRLPPLETTSTHLASGITVAALAALLTLVAAAQ